MCSGHADLSAHPDQPAHRTVPRIGDRHPTREPLRGGLPDPRRPAGLPPHNSGPGPNPPILRSGEPDHRAEPVLLPGAPSEVEMGRTGRLRYLHLRRTIIAVLATVAAFLLLGLIARMLLTLGPRPATGPRLDRELSPISAALDLEIDDLSWGFIPPRLRLNGVRIEGPGIRAEIESAQVDLARVWFTRQTIELGTVVADGVRLALEGTPQRRATGRIKAQGPRPPPSAHPPRVRRHRPARQNRSGADRDGSRLELRRRCTNRFHARRPRRPPAARHEFGEARGGGAAASSKTGCSSRRGPPTATAFPCADSGRVGGEIGTRLVATGTIDLDNP